MNKRLLTGILGLTLIRHTTAHQHHHHSLSFLRNRISAFENRRFPFTRRSYSNPSAPITMFSEIIKNPCAEVIVVPVLSDNYAYILVDPDTKKSFCVDPAEPERVLTSASEKDITISAAFCTHKHYDHSGGNVQIQRLIPGITVFGSSYESVPGVTRGVVDGEVLQFGNLEVRCIKAPCHTIGHVLYYVSNPKKPEMQPIMFTGDTIFVAGCGRFFEGSARMMLDIVGLLKKYPAETLLYCGHEYTLRNLQFAKSVDSSDAVSKKLQWAEETRKMGMPTVPSLLGEEFQYNPFMRASELADSIKETTEEDAMAKLRNMKDRF